MENDETRAKARRTMEHLKAFRSTGTISCFALNHNPSIVKSPFTPPPPPKKGRIVPLQISDRYPLRVPISSPEAVLLLRQIDHEFKDSRDS